MKTWQNYQKQNQNMVDNFMQLAIITSKEVENAFRCVNRAAFVSTELLNEAFVDAPIKGLPFIHMSAPHMYASLLEDLELEPGMSFLNIGSGTGYFSCLVGYLIKKHSVNHGIEIHKEQVEFARERVEDFMANSESDTEEICLPTFIDGNCFQLDPTQMKYDRLYCGGACSQSVVTFFLQFLKIGGFLIAPVGTKLVKLERISQKEGVNTILSDVCFTPLTRLTPGESTQLRHGLLPHLRFPLKSKNKMSQRTIFIKASFPVSKCPMKKKLSRLRAIQNALDYMESDSRIPLPFCYVPHIDQMNAYKQYNKTKSEHLISMANTNKKSIEERNAISAPVLTSVSLLDQQSSSLQESPRQLMTIQQFLLAASPPTVFREFYANQNRSSSHIENREQSFEVVDNPTSRLNVNSNNNNNNESANTSLSSLAPDQITQSLDVIPTRTLKTCRNDIDNVGKDISKDIYEHLCTDKLWEMVVDYYYSVGASTSDRRNQCFRLKGIEIVNPAATKFYDVLFYKLKSKNKSISSDQNNSKPCNDSSHIDINLDLSKVTEELDEKLVSKTANLIDVETSLHELIDKVCHNLDEQSKKDIESSDTVLGLTSMEAVKTGETTDMSSSNDKSVTRNKNKYVDIKTDNEVSEQLACSSIDNWSIDCDIELISFLGNQGKQTDKVALRDSIPSVVKPELFDDLKLTKYPQLASFHPQQLAYRSIVLIRLAKIVDSVLDILVGPSLPRNQFNNPFKDHYPLSSFTEKSFEVSDSQLNVVEAQSNAEKRITSSEIDTSIDDSLTVYLEAKSEKDEELLSEVNAMISYELDNVNQQQTILMRKLQLIDNIDEQFKEQMKLLTQQVELIDEQQRLLSEVQIEADGYEHVQTMHNVADRKLQRQLLIDKKDRISHDRTVQLGERKELLSMLEQLLSLETRLKNEVKALKQKGMGYIQGTESDLSSFSQFVYKTELIVGKLKSTNKKMSNVSSVVNKSKLTNEAPADLSEENLKGKNFTLRYQPQTILPRCRFLLPLSKKRFTFIREMLRSTERSAPKVMPIIRIDRRIPIKERKQHSENSTVFMQIFFGLKNKDLNYRWNKKVYKQWWGVKFSGEGIIDQGGGFRDSLAELSEELCPYSLEDESCLPLFIKTPNQVSGIGDNLDCYTLNPNCYDFHLYRWLGQLMGACFRTDEHLPLPLPPLVWKLLIGEFVSWRKDFVNIDEAAVRNIDGLENLDEDAYSGLHVEQTYSTTLSDGSELDVVPNGSNIAVKCSDRSKFSVLARKARMFENIKQMIALRNGLLSVVPESVLSCLTWKNLEKCVCGDPLISIADLKSNCLYADGLKVFSQCVIHMWAALTSFSNHERSRFLRFITGRKRLPSPFVVSRSSVDRDSLPSASTCGSNLFLPEYSSLQIAKEKIKYAIFNCVAIDTDTSPW